ncbi:hypothetical protein Syun_017437 [Stephania yunnanensis]|uniref:Uncharacterized protein n=1 Tax=Stephania yunnanensis TaxID=152371 RepID=A0AAP0J8J8_9MAGN
MFLATFGGPAGALPTHEVRALVLEMSLLPLKICCDDNLVTLIRIDLWHHLKINDILVNRCVGGLGGHLLQSLMHELEEMVCHADMDMDDREAMRRYNVMTTVRGLKSDDTRNSVKEEPRATTAASEESAEQRRRSRTQPAVAKDHEGDQAAAAQGPSTGGGQSRRLPASAAKGVADLADHGGTGGSGGGSKKRAAAADPKKGAAVATNSGTGRRIPRSGAKENTAQRRRRLAVDQAGLKERDIILRAKYDTRNSVKEERGRPAAMEELGRAAAAEPGPTAAAEDRGGDQAEAAQGQSTGGGQSQMRPASAAQGPRSWRITTTQEAAATVRKNGQRRRIQRRGQRWQRIAAAEENTAQRQQRRRRIPRSGAASRSIG